MTNEQRLTKAMGLLSRAADHCSDNAPDKNWFRDLYLLTGEHMVLTDEGWEPGNMKAVIISDCGEDAILDEVNPESTEKKK